jgi:cytochrome c-type biogenesis protein CcmH
MTTFWILAILLALIASGFIFVPLLLSPNKKQTTGLEGEVGRDLDRTEVNISIYKERLQELDSGRDSGELSGEEYAVFRAELEQTLLLDVGEEQTASVEDSGSSRLVPVIAASAIPLLAILLYADWGGSLGSMADVELAKQLQQPVRAPHEQRSMDDALSNLQIRLKDEPDNHEGWFLLARSMLSRGKNDAAIDALAHLLVSFPEDTGLLATQVHAMYLADGRRITPRVRKIIDRTLALNPHEPSIMEILGMEAFDQGEFQLAIDHFTEMLQQDIPDRQAKAVRDYIARATAQLPAGTAQTPATKAITGKSVNVLVEIDDKIDVAKENVVFVFARAVQGPPMPLAAKKLTVADLPTLVRLDDSMSMDPSFTLSTVEKVQIVARVALSGSVTASRGDWQAVSGPLDLNEEQTVVKLRISEAVQ